MNIIKPSSPVRLKPTNTSPLETECLFGEIVEILDTSTEWCYCKLTTDKYLGWVKKKDLGYLPIATHRVVSLRSFLYSKMDIKSTCINYVPLSAQLHIKDIINDWGIVSLSEDTNDIAYIPMNDIKKLGIIIEDWVTIAEACIFAPYKWGGRDTIGIDCSALLQLSYQNYGANIPRNSKDQSQLKKPVIKDSDNLERGCVVFWDGHVAIMINNSSCIHANAYHMKTIVEPLDIIKTRMKNEKISKIMNFNIKDKAIIK